MKIRHFHITTGDIDGIGLEVSLKALRLLPQFITSGIFHIWCHISQKDFIEDCIKSLPNSVSAYSTPFFDYNEFKSSKNSIIYNFILNQKNEPAHWFESAALDSFKNSRAVITGPLSKQQIIKEGFHDVIGHTQILKKISSVSYLKMAFVGQYFNTILFTDHIPVRDIKIQKNNFIQFIEMSLDFHQKLGLKNKLKLLGLNPHAGDQGLIGKDDDDLKEWIRDYHEYIEGPLASDSAFVDFKNHKTTFLSLYHDQGLIPFKMAHGFTGYHCTLGLPFVRTSVDHGTGKELFGKNLANEKSMLDALLGAYQLINS